MTIQDITQVLAVEVEVPDQGLRNLIANPSGELGGFGWVTEQPGSLQGLEDGFGRPYLAYTTVAGSGIIGPLSERIAVTPGEYVAASWENMANSGGIKSAGHFRFYDSAGVWFSSLGTTVLTDAQGRMATSAVQVPAGAVMASFGYQVSSTTPGLTVPAVGSVFRFREVTVATAVTAAELGPSYVNQVTNPSFETNTTGWTVTSGVGARGAFAEPGAPVAGTQWFRVQPTIAGTPSTVRFTPTMTAYNGRQYRLQVHRGYAPGQADQWSVTLEWRRSDGTLLASTTASPSTTDTVCTIDATAPPGAFGATFKITTLGTHYFDAAMFVLTDGAPPAAYFDGDTPDTAEVTYSWSGVAHASTSNMVASKLPFIPPIIWRNILGSVASINIQRRTFDATLQATIKDINLDPAQEQLLRPGRRVRVTVPPLGDLSSGGAPLFTGRIRKPATAYDFKRAKAGKEATITLSGYGVAADLGAITRPDGVAAATDLPHVLEGVAVPYDVDGNTGQVATPAIASRNPQATALDQVILARDTSLAYAWVNRSGVLMVRTDRTADYYPPNQALELDESVYTGLSVAFDPDDCINSVTVLRLEVKPDTPGEYQEVTYGPYEDANSIRQWGRQAREFRIHGATDPATYAAAVLAANATPVMQVSDLRLRIQDEEDLSPWVLADIYALAHITNARAGVDASLRVLGVDHSIQATAKGVTWDIALSFTGGEDQVAAPVPVTPLPSPTGDLEDTGWTNLARVNGWAVAGGLTPQYRRIGKVVYLRGRVSGGTVGATIATLPADCRPTISMTFVTMQAAVTGGASAGTAHTHNLGNSSARLDVTTAGNISHEGFLNNYVSLDGIVFRTD